jgi:hypothetical protein
MCAKLRQPLLVLQMITILTCLSLSSFAQTPSPTPTPQPVAGGPSFSDSLSTLAIRARQLMPIIRSQLEGPLLPWLEDISWAVAVLVIFAGFARMWRENSGAGADLFWWFARVGIILALMGNGPTIVNRMAEAGQGLAVGGDGQAVLNRFYREQRDLFDVSYINFVKGTFTVKDTSVTPVPGGVLGVIFSTETSIPDATRKLESLSRDMSLLYDGLNLARGVLSFGDFFLMMLSGVLLIASRLAAPVMIAAAIDRSLAQKISYPYLWGVVVLTLIWPIVTLIIKSLAYAAGNIAMAVGDQPVYAFDEATMQIIRNSQTAPVYTVMIAAVTMLIAGLCLWASPVIAYQISVGKVYESVSTTISGWAGALVGAGLEYVSASMAAAVTRQADQVQAQGTFNAEVARADAGLLAGYMGIRARQGEKLAQIFAQRVQQITLANAGRDFQNSLAYAQSGHTYRTWMAGRTKENEDNRVAGRQQLEMQKWGAIGDVLGTGGGSLSRLGVDGLMVGMTLQQGGNLLKWWMQGKAVIDGAGGRTRNIKEYYDAAAKSLNAYTGDLYGAHGTFADAQVGAAKTYASQVAGGVNKAAGIEREANLVTYQGAVSAATQMQAATIEAAKLRSIATVMSAVGHNIAHSAAQGMALRY